MGEQASQTQQHSKQVLGTRPAGTAHCLRRSLTWMNLFTILGSLLSVTAIIVMRHYPTWAGWVFIALGAVTLISGILGLISYTNEGCVSLHFLALGLSLGGLGAASLAIFIKQELVRQHLKSHLSHHHTRILLKLDASLYVGLLFLQVVILVLAFVLHQCYYMDLYYEDIESRSLRRRRNLAKVQEESELRAMENERSQAHELCKKMKQKYGRWTQEGEFDPIKA